MTVFCLLTIILVGGIWYTRKKDLKDIRQTEQRVKIMLDDKGKRIEVLEHVNITKLSIAEKALQFYMRQPHELTVKKVFGVFIKQLHPFFEIKWRFDIEHRRLYRFLLLYIQILIVGVTSLAFYNT